MDVEGFLSAAGVGSTPVPASPTESEVGFSPAFSDCCAVVSATLDDASSSAITHCLLLLWAWCACHVHAVV